MGSPSPRDGEIVEATPRRIDLRPRFRRNYAVLRPRQSCCEEIIELEEEN